MINAVEIVAPHTMITNSRKGLLVVQQITDRINRNWRSHGLCGMEIQLFYTDMELDADQLMYMLTRIRSAEGFKASPTGHKICFWLDNAGVNISIGLNTITIRQNGSLTSEEMRLWIENSLEDCFDEID